MFGFIRKYFSNDLAIDLGTASTRIYVRGKGLVLDEPSVVALRQDKDNPIAAVGHQAKQMVGRVPGNIETVSPMQNGVITDFNIARQMLRQFIAMVHESRLFPPNPRILVCVPCQSSQVERRAIREAAIGAGACAVYLIEKPMAAAIGADLPVGEASGSMIIDIGGGTTEIAVISLAGIVHKRSINVAGIRFDQAIADYVKRHYGMLIGETTAELIKKQIGTAFPGSSNREMEVKGRSLADGIPRSFRISSNEVLEALNDSLNEIVAAIRLALEETPPELGADISQRGIMLSGAGSRLRNIDRLLTQETDLPVLMAEDPENCVARGCGMALERLDKVGALLTTE